MARILRRLLIIALVAVFWIAQSDAASAQSSEPTCQSNLTADLFDMLASRVTAGTKESPDVGVVPNTGQVAFRFSSTPEVTGTARFQVFYRLAPKGEAPSPPGAVADIQVDQENGDHLVTATLDISQADLDTWLLPRAATFLAVLCDPANTAEPYLGVARATLSVSSRFAGIAAAATVFLISLLIFALFYYRAETSRKGWQKLLFMFTNFKDRVSLGLVQIWLFTVTIAMTLAYVYGRTGQLTDLSQDVLGLLGIAAAGSGAAAVVDRGSNSRLSWANWIWLNNHGAFPAKDSDSKLSLSHLVTTGGRFDMFRFQALLFTLFIVPIFVITSMYTLDVATIPQGILAVLGLSQTTYVVAKLTNPPTIQDLDSSLTKTREDLNTTGDRLTPGGFSALRSEVEAALNLTWADLDKAKGLQKSPDTTTLDRLKTALKSNEDAGNAAYSALLVQSRATEAAPHMALLSTHLSTARGKAHTAEKALATHDYDTAMQELRDELTKVETARKALESLLQPPQ